MLPRCQCAANIAPHPEDVYPQPGSPAPSTFDSLPNQANPMPYVGDALAPSQVDSFEVPTGTITQAEEGPFMSPIGCVEDFMAIFATLWTDLPPATNTTTEGGPDFPSHPPLAGPVLGDLISESRDESQLCPPTDLDQDIPVEVMSANPDTCISLFDLLHRPEHKQRKHDFFHQIGGQATHGRSPVCPRCGQECSGRSEMVRHFYSLHLPPTIGCRICKDYKQSRMDSFKSHCKKRHSSESIEGFIVPLENLMIRFTRRRYDQRAETS